MDAERKPCEHRKAIKDLANTQKIAVTYSTLDGPVTETHEVPEGALTAIMNNAGHLAEALGIEITPQSWRDREPLL